MSTARPVSSPGEEAAPSIAVWLNGEERRLPAGLSLATLLGDLGLDPRLVAVERNGEIARRGSFGEIQVVAGDRLEVVRFVQGG